MLAENALRFRNRAENMVKCRGRDRIDQRSVFAIELIVPAAQNGMTQIVSMQPSKRLAGLFGRALLSRLSLRDPGLGDLRLRPATPGNFSDVASGIALIDQAARRIVAIPQRRSY